jgi:hypothetical protein
MKYILIIIVIITLGLAWRYQNRQPDLIEVELPLAREHIEFVEQDNEIIIEDNIEDKVNDEVEEVFVEIEKEEIEITSINLALPFTSQAPTGNWQQPYQDACEEASLLMVDYYYQNKEISSPEETEKIFADMVAWQEDNWGGHFNMPVAKFSEYIDIFYDYRVELVEDVSVAQLENFLDQGLPIIVPADGHKLDNPFFSGDGPEYHMLVIKGYVDGNFITNDPGTWRGEDFIYTYENMMESIHDWDTKKSTASGLRNVLVLYND